MFEWCKVGAKEIWEERTSIINNYDCGFEIRKRIKKLGLLYD